MALYHLSMGFEWPNYGTTGTLQWGAVSVPSTGSPTKSSFSELNSGDTMEFYIYDLTQPTSNASPTLSSSWITITSGVSFDLELFTGSFPLNATFSSFTNNGQNPFSVWFNGTFPCWTISNGSTSSPIAMTIGSNPSTTADSTFGVILQVAASLNSRTVTFTSQDPQMIVNPT
jgi:hypothetical protein